MENAPDFVMYVVMVKKHYADKFTPHWCEDHFTGTHTNGYAQKAIANRMKRAYQQTYGKENVYVQQYGPYS